MKEGMRHLVSRELDLCVFQELAAVQALANRCNRQPSNVVGYKKALNMERVFLRGSPAEAPLLVFQEEENEIVRGSMRYRQEFSLETITRVLPTA